MGWWQRCMTNQLSKLMVPKPWRNIYLFLPGKRVNDNRCSLPFLNMIFLSTWHQITGYSIIFTMICLSSNRDFEQPSRTWFHHPGTLHSPWSRTWPRWQARRCSEHLLVLRKVELLQPGADVPVERILELQRAAAFQGSYGILSNTGCNWLQLLTFPSWFRFLPSVKKKELHRLGRVVWPILDSLQWLARVGISQMLSNYFF